MCQANTITKHIQSFKDGLRPLPDLTVAEWADQYRIIPHSGGNPKPGCWSTALTPYLREIMECLTPSNSTRKVVVMKPVQSGGTEVGINWMGYIMHMNPSSALGIFPTVDMATKWSKQKFIPTIDSTPVLRDIIYEDRVNNTKDTVQMKNFRGGYLALVGSNSEVGLRMLTVKYIYGEEISGYEPSAGDAGDPLKLAEMRCQNFFDHKIYYVSSPKVKGTCRIEAEYFLSDQRHYHVPCPHCNEYQTLEWKQLKFNSNNYKDEIYYECIHCRKKIYEHQKTEMLAKGKWIAANPRSEIAGFTWNGLYNPIDFKGWRSAVKEWIEAQDNTELLKAFFTGFLCETWEDRRNKINENELFESREDYKVVPAAAVILTAGVDVQKSPARIEVSIYGWGKNYHGWCMDHFVIYGEIGDDSTWEQLEDIRNRTYLHESGNEMKIESMAVDTGWNAQAVYNYVKPRQNVNVKAIKGSPTQLYTAFKRPTTPNESGINLFNLNTIMLKDEVYSKIALKHLHFPNHLELEFFKQICAEKIEDHKIGGVITRRYEQTHKNEALDCLVYALFAVKCFNPNFDKRSAKLNNGEVVADLIQDAAIEPPKPVEIIPVEVKKEEVVEPKAEPIVATGPPKHIRNLCNAPLLSSHLT